MKKRLSTGKIVSIMVLLLLPVAHINAQGTITGRVFDADSITPLTGVTVYWSETTTGASTDLDGEFSIRRVRSTSQLIFSFIGYISDTLEVAQDVTEITHIMRPHSREIDEVEVTARHPASHINRLEPVLTVNLTSREFIRAACCNLAESFETNASVDVVYSDAVTGAQQIELLGLAGSYVQIMTENYPAMYGLASPYGLSYVPGPWMESIQISKGTSSVMHGYEGISGQINVEFKKPAESEILYVNGFLNDAMRQEINLNTSAIFNDRLSGMLLFHGAANNRVIDHNRNGFRDEPNARQYHLFNRWDYMTETFTFRTGVRVMQEERISGETGYNRDMADTFSEAYGINIGTTRAEAFSKLGLVFPADRSMTVGWIQNFTFHDQDARFGLRSYIADQRSYYSSLLYQWTPMLSRHTLHAGLSLRHDRFNEMTDDSPSDRTEQIPGAFLQYTYNDTASVTVMAGIRVDNHNLYGTFITPRANLRYNIGSNTTLRASAGKGFRTPSVMAEHFYLLASSRSIDIADDLRAEEALTAGLNITHYQMISGREMRLSAEYYRTTFQNQIVTDLDASFSEVSFYNLDGQSFSNVLHLEAQWAPVEGLDVLAAWRLNDVRATIGGELREKPLASRYKGLLTISWLNRMRRWQYDYTIQLNGPGRIPDTQGLPDHYNPGERFGAFTVMNAHITRFFRQWELYVGVENLLDFKQPHPIIGAEDPFGPNFDGTLIWGPVMGRKIYGGFRFAINRPQ